MANDARALRKLFQSKCAFVSDPPLLGAAATVGAVKQAVTTLVASSLDGDSLLLTFAAHGRAQPEKQESIQLADGWLTDEVMQDLLEPLRTKNVAVTLIVDACQSQGFGVVDRFLPGALASVIYWVADRVRRKRRATAKLSPVKSARSDVVERWRLYLLAAAKKDELAYTDWLTRRRWRGCFSCAIEEVLQPGAQTVADVMAATTTWIGARHADQHPSADVFGRGASTDVFLSDPTNQESV